MTRHRDLRPAPFAHGAQTELRSAAVSALATGLPLIVLIGAGHTREAVFAALGSFAGLYALDTPYPRRGRVLAVVVAGFTAASLAGSLTGRYLPAWTWVVAVASIAGVAKWWGGRASPGGPGAWMFLFIFAVCSQDAELHTGLFPRSLLVLAGGTVAWCVSMLAALHDSDGCARRAVASALEATAAVLESGSQAGEREWHRAHLALTRADSLLQETGASGDLVHALVVTEGLLADAAFDTGSASPASAVTLRQASESLRRPPRRRARRRPPPERSRATRLALSGEVEALRSGLDRHERVLGMLSASRVLLGAGAAATGALLLHLGHAYWAPLSATAVLQSSSVQMTWERSLQRGLGTAGGLSVGGLILAAHPSPLGIALLVVLMQGGVAMYSGRNYALSVLFVTPFAVLLSQLIRPSETSLLLQDRLEGVVLGILVGVMAALLVLHSRAAVTLQHAMERCRVALTWASVEHTDGGVTAVEELRDALMRLRNAHETARGEPWPTGATQQEVRELELRAYRVLARRLQQLRP